jgi:magnesium chelatase family protein
LSRLSGPLIDRIDLQIDVGRVATDELLADPPVTASESERVRSRVVAARARATERLSDEHGVFANAQLGPRLVRRHCLLRGSTRTLLRAAAERLALTARSIHRVLKVSRTIADLDGAPEIEERHLGEALQYRGLERARAQLRE